jgi:adenosylcobinamide-phosphate synthase
MVRRATGLAVGLLAGAAADAVLGDPRRGHPVALFGAGAQTVQRHMYRDTRRAGIAYAAVCVGSAVAAGALVERRLSGPRAYPAVVAAATWAVLGATSLSREAAAVQRQLDAGDVPAARRRMRSLVGRDMSNADESEIARATVESVAENVSDAVVAPLVWGALGGVPGLLGYRAVNTLDAMVGYRSPRYARFGWASARLDDVANVGPSRLTAALTALVSGRPRPVLDIVRRDAPKHPSPNAGWCEAAFAAALGLRLGGTNVYAGRVEHRAVMGDGKPAQAEDILRATSLARRVGLAAVATSVLLAWRRGR